MVPYIIGELTGQEYKHSLALSLIWTGQYFSSINRPPPRSLLSYVTFCTKKNYDCLLNKIENEHTDGIDTATGEKVHLLKRTELNI